jgi:hypothetical protein
MRVFAHLTGNIQSTLMQITLVLILPRHESWENSHANSRFSISSTLMQLLFSFYRGTRVEKTLMQTLASQLSCNSCSRFTETRELRKLSCKLSLLKSHATLVLVLPRHESWENSHANSRFSTLMQLLFSFYRDTRVEKTLMQTLASQVSSSLILSTVAHLTACSFDFFSWKNQQNAMRVGSWELLYREHFKLWINKIKVWWVFHIYNFNFNKIHDSVGKALGPRSGDHQMVQLSCTLIFSFDPGYCMYRCD